MDQLTGMRVFVTVADLGGFNAAARSLTLSRAMVSKHVQAVEERLGARLLNRTTRTISLTEVGGIYLERCRRILEEVDEAEQLAGAMQTEPRGTLRVNGPVSFGTRHLASAMAAFQQRYPAVAVELDLVDRVIDLVDEGYDLAIRIGRLADSSLIARRLAPCHMVLCAAPAYLASHGTPRAPEDLKTHNCLAYTLSNQGRDWTLLRGGKALSLRLGGGLKTNNGDVIQAALLAGQGIAQQPTFIAGPDLAAGRLVRVLPEWSSPDLAVHAIYPHSRHLSAKVRHLVDFLARRFAGTPPWDAGVVF